MGTIGESAEERQIECDGGKKKVPRHNHALRNRFFIYLDCFFQAAPLLNVTNVIHLLLCLFFWWRTQCLFRFHAP